MGNPIDGDTTNDAAASIIRYLLFLQSTLRSLGAPSFNLLPHPSLSPGYIQLDKRALLSFGFNGTVKSALNPQYLASLFGDDVGDVEEVSLLTDGYGAVVTIGVTDLELSSPPPPSSSPPISTSRHNNDAMAMRTGVIDLLDVQNLAQRLNCSHLVGVDPGLRNVVTACSSDVPFASSPKSAAAPHPQKVKISQGWYRKMILSDAWEAVQKRFRKMDQMDPVIIYYTFFFQCMKYSHPLFSLLTDIRRNVDGIYIGRRNPDFLQASSKTLFAFLATVLPDLASKENICPTKDNGNHCKLHHRKKYWSVTKDSHVK